MSQSTADLLRLRVGSDDLRDRGLAELLDDVHRIADGIGGIEQLAIKATTARCRRCGEYLGDHGCVTVGCESDRPAPAPSQFTADEQRALDAVETVIAGSRVIPSNFVVVPVSALSTVYLLACARKVGS